MQDRVTELEIKMAHMEDDLNVLNDTVIGLQSHIERLERKLEGLGEQLDAVTEVRTDGGPADERPPHY